MQPWNTRRRRTVLDMGPFLQIESHQVDLPNGNTIDDWPWVITPDYVNVVVVTSEEHFLCFRQTKYAVEGQTLALVGGYLEPDEEPLVAARREMLEESGYRAPTWTDLGVYAVDGNRGVGKAHLFLAEDAVPVQPVSADDLEEQEIILFERPQIERALRRGEFKALAWPAALSLALLHLG